MSPLAFHSRTRAAHFDFVVVAVMNDSLQPPEVLRKDGAHAERTLTEPVKERLRHVVVDAVRRRHRREFRRFSSLARDLDTPDLRLQFEELARGSDARVRRHATWVLESLAQAERMRRWFVSL